MIPCWMMECSVGSLELSHARAWQAACRLCTSHLGADCYGWATQCDLAHWNICLARSLCTLFGT